MSDKMMSDEEREKVRKKMIKYIQWNMASVVVAMIVGVLGFLVPRNFGTVLEAVAILILLIAFILLFRFYRTFKKKYKVGDIL